MGAHRRSRPRRRRGIHPSHRPGQRHDHHHLRQLPHLPAGDRGRAEHPPGGARGRGDRGAAPHARRGRPCLPGVDRRRLGHRGGAGRSGRGEARLGVAAAFVRLRRRPAPDRQRQDEHPAAAREVRRRARPGRSRDGLSDGLSMISETVGASTTANRIGLVALLSAHIVSMLGSVVTTVAGPWLVLTSTGSAAKMGLISAAAVIPSLLAGVFATPLADRLGIRRTLIGSEALAALAMGAVALTPDIGFLPLAALVAVKGALTGVGSRAQHVVLRPVSDAAGMQIIRTTAIYDGTGNLARVPGAPGGGLLIFWLGPRGAFWFAAASFGLSAVLLGVLVHPPAGSMPDRKEAANERYLAALRRGAGYLWQDRVLIGMLMMTSVINLFTVANYAVFVPVWVEEHFGAAPAVGLILSAFACGAIAGNIAFTIVGPKLPQYLTFTISLVLCVAPRQLTLGLTDNLVVILVVSVLCGVSQAAIRPILGAMLYARVPVELQNRVFGMVSAVTGSSLAFGGTLAGLAVAGIGLQPAILVSGSLCLLITLVPLLRYRSREH